MKVRLERAGEWLEFTRHGRTAFIKHAGGEEREQGFFDDAAAEAGLSELLRAHQAEGWVESAETIARREKQEQERAEAAVRLARAVALTEEADPRAALRSHAGERFAEASEDFEAVLACVVKLEQPSAAGFRVRLSGGRAIEWSLLGDSLWVYDDEETANHALYFGEDAGPPEGDSELAGTPFEGVEVDWFLEEAHQRHWFTTASEPDRARAWDFDGGLVDDASARTPTQVLASAMRALLARG